jgi:hypothetical protein
LARVSGVRDLADNRLRAEQAIARRLRNQRKVRSTPKNRRISLPLLKAEAANSTSRLTSKATRIAKAPRASVR